jgi:hypothetical protein
VPDVADEVAEVSSWPHFSSVSSTLNEEAKSIARAKY